MRVIDFEDELDRVLYDALWNKIYQEYSFFPSFTDRKKEWLSIPLEHKRYRLKRIWNESQEKLVNQIFCDVIGEEMYALDWHHLAFAFDPEEHISYGYRYCDDALDWEVHFPEYYPNGDYHFFVSKDWSSGIYGHPWRKELIVVGEELIRRFDWCQDELYLIEIGGE